MRYTRRFEWLVADTSTAAERTLPHNLEAERSVLGAILIQNDAYNIAVELLRPEDFYRDAHRRIFEKMIALAERRTAIDFVTLKEELGAAGELDTVGGPAYVASLVDGVPRATNVEYYAQIVKEKSMLRKPDLRGQHDPPRRLRGGPGRGRDPRPRRAVDLPDRRGAASARASCRCTTLAQESVETIEKAHEEKKLITGVPTGFQRPRQPDVRLPARRPHHRRGAAVDGEDVAGAEHRAARRAPTTGLTVGVFSLEMSKEQLFLRMLSSRGADRRPPPPHRLPARRRLGPADRGARRPGPGEGLHRRHAGHRRARDAREVAPPGGRARPRPARRRLHPADAGARPLREPDAGARVDLAVAQGAGQGAERSGRRAVAAEPRARSRARTTARSSPTCASRARSSRTPTSSC